MQMNLFETQESMGFNRNIVECKSKYPGTRELSVSGFNRNIVECKLIERLEPETVIFCFNRNIVECKLNSFVKKADWKGF